MSLNQTANHVADYVAYLGTKSNLLLLLLIAGVFSTQIQGQSTFAPIEREALRYFSQPSAGGSSDCFWISLQEYSPRFAAFKTINHCSAAASNLHSRTFFSFSTCRAYASLDAMNTEDMDANSVCQPIAPGRLVLPRDPTGRKAIQFECNTTPGRSVAFDSASNQRCQEIRGDGKWTILDRVFNLYPLGLSYSAVSGTYCPSSLSMTKCGAYSRIGIAAEYLSELDDVSGGMFTVERTYAGFSIVEVRRKDGTSSDILVDLAALAFSRNSGKSWKAILGP